ncbi:hypothetical protein Bbelb_397780 [Branchiostoma belcheri]|nr:hypothetical protein Bbelb_397780 [Branchiostoma belcheri]
MVYRELSSISNVDINNNPWQCDCKILPFRTQMTGSYEFENQMLCSHPANLLGHKLKDLDPVDLICEPNIVRFERHKDYNTSTQGQSLVCEASGFPTPDITVTLPSGLNKTVQSGGRVTVGTNSTVTIDVTADAAGLYVCTATNPVGSTFASLCVNIHLDKPTPFTLEQDLHKPTTFTIEPDPGKPTTFTTEPDPGKPRTFTIEPDPCKPTTFTIEPDPGKSTTFTLEPDLDRPTTFLFEPALKSSPGLTVPRNLGKPENSSELYNNMDKEQAGVLIFLLVILEVFGPTEGRCFTKHRCHFNRMNLTSIPQNLPRHENPTTLEPALTSSPRFTIIRISGKPESSNDEESALSFSLTIHVVELAYEDTDKLSPTGHTEPKTAIVTDQTALSESQAVVKTMINPQYNTVTTSLQHTCEDMNNLPTGPTDSNSNDCTATDNTANVTASQGPTDSNSNDCTATDNTDNVTASQDQTVLGLGNHGKDMENKINSFATSCNRIMLNIKRRDRVTNNSIYNMTQTSPLIQHVRLRQLNFSGHIIRMPEDEPYVQQLLGEEYNQLTEKQIANLARDKGQRRDAPATDR